MTRSSFAIFRRESHPRGERNVRADDRVAAIHVMFLVEVMHRPAEAARTAGRFSEKLRHAGVRARAPGEGVRVIAIGGDEVIVGPRGRDGADHDRFLADVEMAEAADLLRLILLTRAFLKTPDQQHQREHLDFVALLRRLHARLGGARQRRALRGNVPRCDEAHASDKSTVKSRSLTSELRKNIQVGVALYCGKPTVSA